MPLEIVDEYSDSEFARKQTGLLFNLPAPPPEHAQLPAGISLCMIVKNEERFLAECLRSVADVVDEMIVVDTGSTDRTVEIARSFGARVEHREWRNDFAWARNEALALATRRWTLVLDADEEITPESLVLLRAVRETRAYLTGIYLQIRNVVEDESGGATMTHQLPRMFPTTPRIRFRNVIHESVSLDGSEDFVAAVSPIVILHKGYTREMLAARGKDSRNKALVKRAVELEGDSAFTWFNFGLSALVAGDTDAGIEALNKMFELARAMEYKRAYFGVAYTQLAQAYADCKQDYDLALATIDRGLEDVPDYPGLLFMRGYTLSLKGDYDAAREWYAKAIDVAPDARRHFLVDDEIREWKAAVNIASCFLKEDRAAEAIPWLETALRNKPGSPAIRRLAATTYEKAGRYYEAEQLVREGLADPDGAGPMNYVNFLLRRARFEEAFTFLERERVAFAPEALAALLLDAARRCERPDDAERYASRALELAPGDGAVLAFLDEHYRVRGETGKRDALRAAELDAPLRATADYARRSHRLLEEGRHDDALAAAEAGLLLGSAAVLHYNAALAHARGGRDAQALAHLAQVDAADPLATVALALRAEIARRGGDFDGAIAALEQAHALPGRDDAMVRTAAAGLATALLEAGRLEQAGKLAQLVLA